MEGMLFILLFLLRVVVVGIWSVGLYGVVNEVLFVSIGLVDKVVGLVVVMVMVVEGGLVGEVGGIIFVDEFVEGVLFVVDCVVGVVVGCLVVVVFGCSNSVVFLIIFLGISLL